MTPYIRYIITVLRTASQNHAVIKPQQFFLSVRIRPSVIDILQSSQKVYPLYCLSPLVSSHYEARTLIPFIYKIRHYQEEHGSSRNRPKSTLS